MARIGLLNAYGSTVGDNLEHYLIQDLLRRQGWRVIHLWNFNRQDPKEVQALSGLAVGGGGVLWNGSDLRNYFFVNSIMLSKRAAGVSIGYNQSEPLSARWIRAVAKMDYVSARDPWTTEWIKENTKTRVIEAPSIAWLYKIGRAPISPEYDVGLIYNQKACQMNYGTGHPFKLFPGLRKFKVCEIPFAEPVETPILVATHNPHKRAYVACGSIQRCKVIVTARLHGFILSLLSKVPAIAVDDTFKIAGQVAMCKYPHMRKIEFLRALKPQGWRELIDAVRSLDVEPFAWNMIKNAEIHKKELLTWSGKLARGR